MMSVHFESQNRSLDVDAEVFYTKAYLGQNPDLMTIRLDRRAEIFQNLDGVAGATITEHNNLIMVVLNSY